MFTASGISERGIGVGYGGVGDDDQMPVTHQKAVVKSKIVP